MKKWVAKPRAVVAAPPSWALDRPIHPAATDRKIRGGETPALIPQKTQAYVTSKAPARRPPATTKAQGLLMAARERPAGNGSADLDISAENMRPHLRHDPIDTGRYPLTRVVSRVPDDGVFSSLQ
jgi:hypothetical protein